MEENGSNIERNVLRSSESAENLARVSKEFQLLLSDPHIPEEIRNALLEGYVSELSLESKIKIRS